MRLSIIIPAHNEAATIKEVLEKVSAVNFGPWEKEIIVVNDGSSDNTGSIAEQWALLPNNGAHCIVVHHKNNMGKGAGIQTGLKVASGDYVIIQDADAEYDPADIPKLLSVVAEGAPLTRGAPSAHVPLAVFGARGHKAYPERGFHYVVGAWMLTTLFNLFYWQKLTDLYTCYKLIPGKVFKELDIKSTGFEFEAEVACKLALRGIKITETPIGYKPRNKEQGKHIRLIDAVKGFWSILKYRF